MATIMKPQFTVTRSHALTEWQWTGNDKMLEKHRIDALKFVMALQLAQGETATLWEGSKGDKIIMERVGR